VRHSIYNLTRLYQTLQSVRESSRFLKFEEVTCGCPSGSALLRFDLERDVLHHVTLGRWLAARGIRATFFVHTRAECFIPIALRELEGMGHGVGYHHECLDRCRGDWARARSLFLTEADMFRRHGISLRTCCSHGENGIRRNGYSANWELMKRYPELLGEAGIAAEMYEWLRANPLAYATDTFRGVRRFFKVADDALDRRATLMMLVHAHRWRDSIPAITSEVATDLIQFSRNKVAGHRSYRLPSFASS
jgi:hypothetical protein